MLKSKRKIQGVTLVEIMLVAVISAFVFMLGYQQYASIRNDADLAQVKFNVDMIFAAAAGYYQANCRMQYDPATNITNTATGLLDPKHIPAPSNPYPVTISTLKSEGFLTYKLPANKLINSAAANSGYTVQFNQYTADQLISGHKMGNIYIWSIQVAVAIRGSTPKAVISELGADCASVSGGTTVTKCGGSTPANANYAVWERMPSFAAPNADPGNWVTNSQMKEFNLMYTNNMTNNWQPSGLGGPTDYQNFLCGSN